MNFSYGTRRSKRGWVGNRLLTWRRGLEICFFQKQKEVDGVENRETTDLMKLEVERDWWSGKQRDYRSSEIRSRKGNKRSGWVGNGKGLKICCSRNLKGRLEIWESGKQKETRGLTE